jgi:hypothetical protein
MTLTNHLLAGAAISKFLPWPLAVPVAFASHFMLDALPHFGFKTIAERKNHKLLMAGFVILDVVAVVIVSVWLIGSGRSGQFYIGLVACSPDLLWIYRFTVEEKFGKLSPTKGNRFIQFHMNIQKYERVWGGLVEVLYAAVLLAVVR